MHFLYMMDPLYWVMMLPVMVFAIYAQTKVKMAYSKYSRVGTSRGLSGMEAAKKILDSQGITDVEVEETEGWLSDHYDPKSKTLRLSPEVYRGRSVAAVGIAAHETGHAVQHAFGYGMMYARTAIVPMANIGSWVAFPMIVLGALLGSLGLVKVGIVLFAVLVVFQVVTLPVEVNASSRARELLTSTGVVVNEAEEEGVRRVLSAAALTYVAATATAVVTLLYYLMRFGLLGGRSRD